MLLLVKLMMKKLKDVQLNNIFYIYMYLFFNKNNYKKIM